MYMYSDESGLLGPGKKQSYYFGLGGLVIPDNEIGHVRKIIRGLREKHNFFINFEYKNGTRHKVPFCKDLIDWYFSYKDIGFFALVLRTADLDWSYFEKGNQQAHVVCYSFFYRKMLNLFYRDYIEEGNHVRIVIDQQSIGQRALRNRFDYFKDAPAIIDCREEISHKDDLLQFVDLLISCTVNRFTLFEHPDHTVNPVKNDLSEYIMGKLQLRYFWNWRRVGETWGPPDIRWVKDRNDPDWERPATPGTKRWKHKFDLFSWHGR